MNVLGLRGQKYELEPMPFDQGGEGDIYGIVGIQDRVVKVYHPDHITSELEQKISRMVQNPPNQSVLTQVAWPLDVVYDMSKRFCGFVMPRLHITADLSEVYVYPPRTEITYKQKLTIAQNICVVISAVHEAGYIFGDFNPRNIGINTNNGSVAFLDTDSYHIVYDRSANRAYRCNVCAPGYAAPELLEKCAQHIALHPEDAKKAYATAPLDTFTKETDYFALAIHIYKLLMNGFTPFNGISDKESASVGSPGVNDEAVRRNSYCFKPGNKPMAAAVPPIEVLPEAIKDLFTRAFIYGHADPKMRPSAVDWYYALQDYENALVVCTVDHRHYYKSGLSNCPWCEADKAYQRLLQTPMKQKTYVQAPVVPVQVPTYQPTPSQSSGSTSVSSAPSSALSSASGKSSNGSTVQSKSMTNSNGNSTKGWVFGIIAVVALVIIVFAVKGNSSGSPQTYFEDVTPIEYKTGSLDENVVNLATLQGTIIGSDGLGPYYSSEACTEDNVGNRYNVYFTGATGNGHFGYGGKLEYNINGAFSTFECRFALTDAYRYTPKRDKSWLQIYCDGEEVVNERIYKGKKPKDITVDVEGVRTLTIYIWNNEVGWDHTYDMPLTPAIMANAYLCKDGYSFRNGQY